MKYHFLTDDSEKSLAPFFSKTMLTANFTGVVVISILLIISWPHQPLSGFMHQNKAPLVFFVIFAATLIVTSYINLCCGRGEMIRRGYHIIKYRTDRSTLEKENDFLKYGLIAFLLHSSILLLLFLPHLILAASISSVGLLQSLKAVSILYSASLLCRLFGFMVYLFWGRASTLGYFIARTFMIVFIFGTFFLAPCLNPIQFLYKLNEKAGADGWSFAFYMLTVIFAILFLIGANHQLVRRHLGETRT
jgi:hypothetical protein